MHSGGWDKINGGQSTLALAVLTGCMDAYTISNANFKNGKPASFQMWKPANGGYPSYRENNPGGGSRSLTQVSTQRTSVCEYSEYPGLDRSRRQSGRAAARRPRARRSSSTSSPNGTRRTTSSARAPAPVRECCEYSEYPVGHERSGVPV